MFCKMAQERPWQAKGLHSGREPEASWQDMPCRQSLSGEFIERRIKGKKEEKRDTERKKRQEQEWQSLSLFFFF